MSTKTALRTGGWNSAQRKKLSAIRVPHKSDPKDFYLDTAAAFALLGGTGDPPMTLNVADELQRMEDASNRIGVSWNERSGRNFSNEYWNPLLAFWLGVADWDFVFEMILPKGKVAADSIEAPEWYAVRRYLSRATPEEYERARARCEPTFRLLCETTEYRGVKLRDAIAFAFIKSDWGDELLRGFNPHSSLSPNIDMLVAGSTDTQLCRDVIRVYGGLDDVGFVFDLVESHGADAREFLALLEPNDSNDKKRVAQAMKIANNLAD